MISAEMHVSVTVKEKKEEENKQTSNNEENVFFVNEKGEKILVLLKTINF